MVIKTKGMDLHIKTSALKVEDGDIIRFKSYFAVADIHAYAVKEVVAVCFDNQLFTVSGEATKESGECCLCAWVKMYLRLLPEGELWGIRAQEFGDHGKNLADAVTDIDQVAPRPFMAFANLKLEGCAGAGTEPIDLDFIKEARSLPKPLDLGL